MIVRLGPKHLSSAVKGRPASSRVPRAVKYPGETQRASAVTLSKFRAVSSLYAYGWSAPLPVSGSWLVLAAEVTPGSRARFRSSSSQKALRFAA